MNIESILQRHIVDDILMGKKTAVGVDQSLFGSGILDSVRLLQLIAFVERHFGVQIADAEMNADNFRTIARIKALIESKQNTAEAG